MPRKSRESNALKLVHRLNPPAAAANPFAIVSGDVGNECLLSTQSSRCGLQEQTLPYALNANAERRRRGAGQPPGAVPQAGFTLSSQGLLPAMHALIEVATH